MEHTFLEIDTEKELQKVIAQLKKLPDQITSPSILASAINTTARRTRTRLLKDAKERYAVTDESVWKDKDEGAPKVLTANAASLTATVLSRGPMLDAMKFVTEPNGAASAAALGVLNSGNLTPLEKGGLKAFLVTFSSGHEAIVQRDPPNQYTHGDSIRKRREKYQGKADMTKIKKILSPAVPHMLGNEEVRAKAEGIAYETLQKEIQKRIDKINLG